MGSQFAPMVALLGIFIDVAFVFLCRFWLNRYWAMVVLAVIIPVTVFIVAPFALLGDPKYYTGMLDEPAVFRVYFCACLIVVNTLIVSLRTVK